MGLRSIFVACMLCGSFMSSSQSVYEFKYSFVVDKVKEDYHALIFRYDDASGFIRVRLWDEETKSWVVVDMELEEHYYGDTRQGGEAKLDTSMVVFEGHSPHVIIGDPKIEYDPDLFIFQYDPRSGLYEPTEVLSFDDKDNMFKGKVDQMTLLEQKDLTKEKLSLFFKPDEDFFKNYFDQAEVRSLSIEERKTRLHLLLVANTEDITIGKTCKVDQAAMIKTFGQIAEFMGIQFSLTEIFGTYFSKLNVEKAIESLKPSPNDIVVFYYSGHGFNDDKANTKFPFLDLRDKSYQTFGGAYTMNIEDIYNRIKSKGARLNLVLSDCCNADPAATTINAGNGVSTRSSSIGWNQENVRALFLNNKRMSILMTAAAKGELSAGNDDGGIFTFNFRESLEKLIGPFYTNISWKSILDAAQKQTINGAQTKWCRQPDNSWKRCLQNPRFITE